MEKSFRSFQCTECGERVELARGRTRQYSRGVPDTGARRNGYVLPMLRISCENYAHANQ